MATLLSCTAVFLGAPSAFATTLDDVGFTALQNELGAATPDGSGVSISQVEAANATGSYSPDAANAELTGKSFNILGTSPDVSNHATTVGKSLYGVNSVAGGVTDINVFEVNGFLSTRLLKFNNADPLIETQDIQNHSWIGTVESVSGDQQLNQRLDFLVNRDDVVVVAALNNGTASAVPPLFANSFNSIITGVTDGDHSDGFATLESPDRAVPHIVAPSAFTSFANPVVAASAALLLETAREDAALDQANRNEVIRSLLLTGATKDEFATDPQPWSNTSTNPLDSRFGAGELHIQRSHHVLTAGQQAPSATTDVDSWGWDLQTDATGTQTYFFDVPSGSIEEFSAVLTWNREITDTNPFGGFAPVYDGLNDLDLRLFTADGFAVDSLIAESTGSGNVEHIYLNDELGIGSPLEAGRYALVVDGGTEAQDFAVSWFRKFASDAPACDFDGDGDCDATDLADLYASFGSADAAFDLDGNGTVDSADINSWLTAASTTDNSANPNGLTFLRGDVDFDGAVNSTDLGIVLNNFGNGDSLPYGSGNLNGDALVNSTDLGMLLNNFGFDSNLLPTSAMAVPEPTHLAWVALLLFTVLAIRQQRN